MALALSLKDISIYDMKKYFIELYNLLIFLYYILKNCCNYHSNEIQKERLVVYENFITLYQV